MQFEPQPSQALLKCNECQATGTVRGRRCPVCRGMALGTVVDGTWLFWRYPLGHFELVLRQTRKKMQFVRRVTVALFALNAWGWTAFMVYRLLQAEHAGSSIVAMPSIQLLFWVGTLFWCYFFYRSVVDKRQSMRIRRDTKSYRGEKQVLVVDGWQNAVQLPKQKKHNVADFYTPGALGVYEAAYELAYKRLDKEVSGVHIFSALTENDTIRYIFVRLGITPAGWGDAYTRLMSGLLERPEGTSPVLGQEFYETLFGAYHQAFEAREECVDVADVLLAVIAVTPSLQEFLYDIGVEKQKLINVVEWVRVRERLRREYQRFREAAHRRSKHGMDRAMTAVATPFLNQFSEDVTELARRGYINTCVARDKEIDDIFQIVDGGEHSVLLVGEHGVGKKSIIEGIAERMIEDDVPERMYDKRLVRLNISALLAGTTPAGAVERLISIMREVARAGNIVLCIHNLHDLMGVSTGSKGDGLDVAGALVEYLSQGNFLTIATTSAEAYAQQVANTQLNTVFSKVDVGEMDENQAIQVLESKAGHLEYKHQVFFAYQALEKAVQLARRFVRETTLPGSALEIIAEAAVKVHAQKGGNALVSGDDVAAVVSEITKIPVANVSGDETAKLLHLEEALHRRVVGQDEAVSAVANALRRARASIRSNKRPIASFLFLGPTGVGKTELAKTIAEVYFGGEERMARFDMSEFQDKSSVHRLIGVPGEQGTGLLTEAIRKNPFTLLLLDEIEKADRDVLNLFLQVMDDGRLTDSTGRLVDFTNTIIIATSNAGTAYVQEQLKKGVTSEAIRERLLHGELATYFRPEFLNRYDGVILFKSLDGEAIKKVAELMVAQVRKMLEEKGVALEVTEAGLEFIAAAGFDPDFGARPLRRVLQEKVENKLAELILSNQLKRKDIITIDEGGRMTVTSKT